MKAGRTQCKDIPDQLILDLIRARDRGLIPATMSPDVALADRYPSKLVLTKMEQMVRRKILEVGTSTRYAWIAEDSESD